MGKDKLRPGSKLGLSLERFAHAKISSYDKTSRKEREFALNAKRVNKYRKLKQRLLKAGKLKPIAVLDEVRVCRVPAECHTLKILLILENSV
jgi:hypothetical protein